MNSVMRRDGMAISGIPFGSDECPLSGGYGDWQTMCDSVSNLVFGDSDYGKSFRRTLEAHDKDTFENAYD
jgi:hypothetical protein